MSVREYTSQRDHVGSLPLVSESTTVADVTVMDRNRRGEVRAALLALGSRRGFRGAVPEQEPIDWNAVPKAVTRADEMLAPRLRVLYDRWCVVCARWGERPERRVHHTARLLPGAVQ